MVARLWRNSNKVDGPLSTGERNDMAKKTEENRRGANIEGILVEGTWTKEGDFIPADGSPILRHDPDDDKTNATEETGPLLDGSFQRVGLGDSYVVSEGMDKMLFEIGRRLGEEGYIFVGGLIPYTKKPDGGWEMDTEKDPVRLTNINEAQSVRVVMGLFAYLIETMQGELAAELGLEAKMKGQKPA